MIKIFNKLKTINETLLACIALLIVAMIFVFYTQKNDDSLGFKCPSDFNPSEKYEYADSVGQWINAYQNKHPEASTEEVIAARNKLMKKNKCGKSPFTADDLISNMINSEEFTEGVKEGIKYAESQRPPGIEEDPSDEEIYNNPYVKHIRTALDGHLSGTSNGVEEDGTLGNDSENLNCGPNSFDKSYYKSKFIVFDAENSDYGGVSAHIVFINKPDTIFWTWIYQYDSGEYTLRAFCKDGPPEDKEGEFKNFINGIIKESKFSL